MVRERWVRLTYVWLKESGVGLQGCVRGVGVIDEVGSWLVERRLIVASTREVMRSGSLWLSDAEWMTGV